MPVLFAAFVTKRKPRRDEVLAGTDGVGTLYAIESEIRDRRAIALIAEPPISRVDELLPWNIKALIVAANLLSLSP